MSRPSDAVQGLPVAVTGAGGFIGRRVVAALIEAGADVTAILRSGHEAGSLLAMGAAVAVAPLAAGPRLATALRGKAVLFHFAYDMRAGAASNLEAFDALIAAARAAGVARIVHASSAVVYDNWPGGALDENSPITPGGGEYRRAKIEMENRLLQGDLDAAILQPTIVYGPGSALWTDGPISALRQGPVILPDPVGHCPALFVDDLAQAAVLAAGLPDLGRERFLISGPDQPGWDAFFDGYAGLIGQGAVELRPAAELAARLGPAPTTPKGPSSAARISAALRRILGRRRFETWVAKARRLRPAQGPVWPDRGALALYAATPQIDLTRARRRLGYAPAHDFNKGLDAIRAQLLRRG